MLHSHIEKVTISATMQVRIGSATWEICRVWSMMYDLCHACGKGYCVTRKVCFFKLIL